MSSTIPLGKVVEIRGGGTPSRSVERYWGGPIPWATVKDFKSTRLDKTLESITPEGVKNSATSIVPAGSIIVPTRMAVGKAAINSVDVAINQDLKALLPKKNIDPNFLLHFLLSKSEFLESRAQGATVKGIKLELLRALEFPNLRVEEQRRIANILDKADGIRRKLMLLERLLDESIRSVFQEMFGDPQSNKFGFKVGHLEHLCELITDCLHTTPDHFDEPNAYPSIRSSELQGGYIDLSSAKYVTEEEYNVRIQRYRPEPDDIIYCREGARYGSVGRIPEGMTPCLGQRTMLLKANRGICNPDYLWSVMRSDFILDRANQAVGGAASPHVNIGDIRKFPSLMPPLEVQEEFSRKCRNLLRQRERVLEQGRQATLLFLVLSQRAFRGEL